MLKNVFYFSDERGRFPVEEFIHSLPPDERKKIYSYISALREFGHRLRRPMADYVTQGLYELRPRANRVFYGITGWYGVKSCMSLPLFHNMIFECRKG